MSKLQVFLYFCIICILNFAVFASDINFTEAVICQAGDKIAVDHRVGSKEDYCLKAQSTSVSGPRPAKCPQFNPKNLKKSLLSSSFLNIKNHGVEVNNIIERLVSSLGREEKLVFSKRRNKGRDLCILKIDKSEIVRFIPQK